MNNEDSRKGNLIIIFILLAMMIYLFGFHNLIGFYPPLGGLIVVIGLIKLLDALT